MNSNFLSFFFLFSKLTSDSTQNDSLLFQNDYKSFERLSVPKLFNRIVIEYRVRVQAFERIIQYSGLKQETRSTEIHVLLLKLRFQVIFIRVKLKLGVRSKGRGTCVAVYPRFSAPSVRPKLCPRCNISGNVWTSQPPRNQEP